MPSCDLFCLLLCFFGSRGRGHDLRLASWVLSKLPKCAVLVGSRLRRSTLARACTPLTKSKEKERLLAVRLFSATILSCIPSNTDSAALVLKASNSEKLTPHLLATWTVYSSFNTNYAQMLAWTLILIYICIWTLHRYQDLREEKSTAVFPTQTLIGSLRLSIFSLFSPTSEPVLRIILYWIVDLPMFMIQSSKRWQTFSSG